MRKKLGGIIEPLALKKISLNCEVRTIVNFYDKKSILKKFTACLQYLP